MALLKEKDVKKLKELFAKLENSVTLKMFTQENECHYCEHTRELVEEVTALSDKIKAEIHDFVAEAQVAKEHGVDKIPAVIPAGEKDYGIRFYGVPAGYEFTTLVEDIIDVGRRDPGLSEEIAAELAKVNSPVHIQVLFSPT